MTKLKLKYATTEDAKFFINEILSDLNAINKLCIDGNREDLFENGEYKSCFVATLKDKPIGFLRLQSSEMGFNYLSEIYILPFYRKNGYGDYLIKFAINYSYRNWNALGIDCFTIDNPIMEKLLKKNGFKLMSSDKKRYFRAGRFQGQKRWLKLYD